MAFNRKQKLRDNIEAIRTAFILDREQRTATTEERAILQRYCGFGGLKCILNPAKELTDAVRWAKSDLELFAPYYRFLEVGRIQRISIDFHPIKVVRELVQVVSLITIP